LNLSFRWVKRDDLPAGHARWHIIAACALLSRAAHRTDRLTPDREDARRSFLAETGFAGARREPLAGDASTRRYERLHTASGATLILMDQPPAVETHPCPPGADAEARAALGYNALARLAAGRVDAFVACAGYLRSQGLSAPAVVAADFTAGLALLEDLGDDLYARLIESGADEAPLYDAATDVLVRLHAQRPPDVLEADGAAWPLLVYDALALQTGGDLFLEWLPRLHPSLDFGEEARAEWRALWDPVRAAGEAGATVFCHRDFHAENLIWLSTRRGAARVGLLDFQDALRAHPAWDLSMLLHDARRDVSAEREAAVLRRYLAARPRADGREFIAGFHALGALNTARILGLFARLVVRDGKPRYRAFMPRLWRYMDRCLAEPAPRGLGEWLARHVPPEVRA
jgi:aminoglycoside/choline kinase family phosphotransferase